MKRMITTQKSSLRAAALMAVAALALSGCAETKRAMGYDKAPPDEFQVVSRAPLTMPPDFTLRPPTPGMERPQEGNVRDQARRALTGNPRANTPIATQGRTQGDVALLKKAGAEQINPEIRLLVNKETQSLADADKSFTDKLVFWRKPEGVGAGEQLNAGQEAQRLRENQALGNALSTGDTPRIERRRKGMLEGIW
ncbi:DUF3035 domain-containing protein [Magnetospirillum gryphiswaldense]|uniref:DUF3035 domain-containing protein n=2 Tax=Magnetospirillum gryphiswaldense TaxID=55518 RepID=V6F646_MAGGM|nr:DUF3035 domain-containing protein [Magnetospirillum gryphiswaldense]CAM75546.1 conserved hypothetical protein, secreted [Magnetospirillum gryphiswaldense MSR-1]CDK99978.1 conserved protein of unknown function [Magnetospirillum gryphiswaldense MSR-1 v2]